MQIKQVLENCRVDGEAEREKYTEVIEKAKNRATCDGCDETRGYCLWL